MSRTEGFEYRYFASLRSCSAPSDQMAGKPAKGSLGKKTSLGAPSISLVATPRGRQGLAPEALSTRNSCSYITSSSSHNAVSTNSRA